MKFYHRTTEKAWKAIQEEGCLWGITGWGTIKERIKDAKNRARYTYLAPDDWGDSYGTVLLEVEYEPKREEASVSVGGYIKHNDNTPIKNNYGFDPPQGQQCVQFCVFEPISLDKVKRIAVGKYGKNTKH